MARMYKSKKPKSYKRKASKRGKRKSYKKKKYDKTITKIGLLRDTQLTMSMCSLPIEPFVSAVGGGVLLATVANGPQFLSTTVSPLFWSTFTRFDPSGYLQTLSGPQPGSVVPDTANGIGLFNKVQDWDSMSAMYQYYKVTKVTVKFSAHNFGFVDAGSSELIIRHCTDPRYPTSLSMSQTAGFIKKTFTTDSPTFTKTFIPMEMVLVDTASAVNVETRQPRKMRWSPCNNPTELWGMQMWLVIPPTQTATHHAINCDITYTIKFKTRV